MSGIDPMRIKGKIDFSPKELPLITENDSRTMIDDESRDIFFDYKKHNVDEDEIQEFYRSKAKLFEPDLFSNKNNNLINVDMGSKEVKKIREEFNMTQQGFADFLGVDRRTVVNWEQGKKIPESKVKLFKLELEKRRNLSTTNTIIEKIENKTDSQSLDNLNREILVLNDHIKTLKDFLDDKTTMCDIYKNENILLKERLERLT
jgi:DNA-binding transcriptional regulator YiaG